MLKYGETYKILALFGFSDPSDSDATTDVCDHSIKSSSTNVKFSIDTLMEETKPVVSQTFEIENC